MKGIPGTSPALIRELGRYVDRMSVNIELPSSSGLKLLAPQKTKEGILRPMREVHTGIMERQEERKSIARCRPLCLQDNRLNSSSVQRRTAIRLFATQSGSI